MVEGSMVGARFTLHPNMELRESQLYEAEGLAPWDLQVLGDTDGDGVAYDDDGLG